VLIALAASPGLEDTEVAEQLKARADALSARLAELRAIRARQEPLPAAASAIFSYSEAMLLAELSWAHETAATYERATDHEDEIGDMTEPANDRPTKYDIKRVHKRLYSPAPAEFTIVDVPPISYLTADGHGDPNTSPLYSDVLAALYSVAYKLKFTSKNQLGRDLVVGPLEGLWRADDMSAFTRRDKEAWQWTLMISQPGWITADMVESAVATVRAEKELSALDGVSLRVVDEGMAVQTLHIGSYDDEAPTLDRLHLEFLPSNGLTFNGDHHEIYLSDARRTAPEKLRTILRQPVKPL
jgi:hypothetical protein